ncbi:unspecific monooxygenase [Spizellomyces sp. 'palustris']|nr:unspecific monooxygenase [Spizellomyces sp. 'palustris']
MPKNIPQPPSTFLLGNVGEIDSEFPLGSFERLADLYGPIYRLDIAGRKQTFISSQELVDEVCDEKNFEKGVQGALVELRNLLGDGLFTAYNEEPNWALAHKILMPAFSPTYLTSLFPSMHDIATQLTLKWERFGEDYRINAAQDFTRLTLDTLALCSFDYRLNSFYNEEMHPFIEAMVNVLVESGRRSQRVPVQQSLMFRTTRKFQQDISFIHEFCDQIVQKRREDPTDRKDLLNMMLNGRDKETGQRLSTVNIRFQMVTFLVAGHETTSGLLSFAFFYLLNNPYALQKAQSEVDQVTGGKPVTVDHIFKLPYIDAVLKETLRLQPPAPFFTRKVKATEGQTNYTFKHGEYEVTGHEVISVIIAKLHRDSKVWGEDAEEFRPERMLEGKFAALPPNSWKPFGSGVRACIGRSFAWQESLLVVAMILQKFDMEKADPAYDLRVKQTLTIKPSDFYMKAKVRKNSRATRASSDDAGEPKAIKEREVLLKEPKTATRDTGADLKLTILFGSNAGSCESFADRLASDAPSHGFAATTAALDSATRELLTTNPVAIICSSYEGQPPDNARQFVAWLTSSPASDELKGVKYAVFGCGHTSWAQTYQRIPILIDEMLHEKGAERLLHRGCADAAGDFFGEFDTWEDNFWRMMQDKFGARSSTIEAEDLDAGDAANVTSTFQVQVLNDNRATVLSRTTFEYGVVVENRQLTSDVLTCGGMPKQHLEISLPEGMTYRAGDYLGVMPINPIQDVKRVLHRFKLPVDANIMIKTAKRTFLPTNLPIPVHTVLGGYVELNQPASRRQVETLRLLAPAELKPAFSRINHENYNTEILNQRVSVLDLLELYPAHPLEFGHFLSMLPPMRMRQYSISSSPLWNPFHVTLTIDVLKAPAISGHETKLGVASTYLSRTSEGEMISCVVRPSAAEFHLSLDPTVPIIMVATGSGMSPMRGFIQERAAMVACGRKVGKALLYYGCRNAEEDFIYKDELQRWTALGVVDVRPSFSSGSGVLTPPASPSSYSDRATQHKYVYEAIYADREELKEMFIDGARFYVCGSATKLAKSVGETFVQIYREMKGVGEEEAQKWFEELKGVRYATDVFG